MQPSKKSNIEKMLVGNEELEMENIDYLMYKTANKNDYLLLNYIEQTIVKNFGDKFVQQSADKIELITNYLLEDNKQKLFDYYEGTLQEYMKMCNNSFEGVTSFNLVFLTHIHLALKIIRSSVKET